MSQVGFENTLGQQTLNVTDALVTRPFELVENQPGLAIGSVELLGAESRIPFWLEGGKNARDLVEADAIGSFIRTGVRCCCGGKMMTATGKNNPVHTMNRSNGSISATLSGSASGPWGIKKMIRPRFQGGCRHSLYPSDWSQIIPIRSIRSQPLCIA